MTAPPPVFLDAGPVTLHPVEADRDESPDGETDLDFCHRLVTDERVRRGLTLYRPRSVAEEREFVDSLDSGVRLIARAEGRTRRRRRPGKRRRRVRRRGTRLLLRPGVLGRRLRPGGRRARRDLRVRRTSSSQGVRARPRTQFGVPAAARPPRLRARGATARPGVRPRGTRRRAPVRPARIGVGRGRVNGAGGERVTR